jgi:predicted component of type VI protein secretion system
MNVPRLVAGMITMLSVLATAACSVGAPTDRAGGETVTLKLATIDHVNPDGLSECRPLLTASPRFRTAASTSK